MPQEARNNFLISVVGLNMLLSIPYIVHLYDVQCLERVSSLIMTRIWLSTIRESSYLKTREIGDVYRV